MFTNGTLLPFRRLDDNIDDEDQSPPQQTAATAPEIPPPDRYYANVGRQPAAYANRDDGPINQLYAQDDSFYRRQRPQQWQREPPQLERRYDDNRVLGEQIARYTSADAIDRQSYRPWPAETVQQRPPARRHHLIYPALGKRSVREVRTSVEQYSAHHHRSTRHTLYASIERYLRAATAGNCNGHSEDGRSGGGQQQCVQRMLCETARKRLETQPGSFVGELMRVVFTLPDVAAHAADHERLRREDRYHEAYHENGLEGGDLISCAAKYPQCTLSLYGSVYAK